MNTESQAHGLIWEYIILFYIFGLEKNNNYTSKFDIPCSKNKYDSNENISIKTTSSNSIDCGDIMRFFSRSKENITIIVIVYKQVGDYKKIVEILEINYTEELRNILFGTITIEVLNEYITFIKSIPNGKVSADTKRLYKKMKKDLQMNYGMKINISPKVDSKNQRRVQCSIPNISAIHPSFIISKTTEPIIRNIYIEPQILSARRKRAIKTSID
jgi:hypothetical protein